MTTRTTRPMFAALALFALALPASAGEPFNFAGEVEVRRVTFAAPDGNNAPEAYAQVELQVSGVRVVCDQRISERCAEVEVGDVIAVRATVISCRQCLRLGLGQNLVLAHAVSVQ